MLMSERPFSDGGRPAGAELKWGLLTDTRPQRGGGSAGEGSLRGQGSELSGDPTTTNAALNFKLFHHPPCKTPGELTSSL